MSECSEVNEGDSFWEPGHFKRATKRIEDGYKLCVDLQHLINERADIERSYAKSLQNWAKKWNDLIDRGPEYGSMVAAWKGVLNEAERISQIHSTIKDNLCANEIQQVKTFQKDNYRKSMLQLKQRKEIEDEFKKVQKPWIKHLTNVDKSKSDYHAAFKNEKITLIQEKISIGDSSLSQDQIKKIHDHAVKAREELPKCREKYEQALVEIDQYSPTYVDEMTSVFVKCQEMEKTRKRFSKQVLISMLKTINITQYSDLQPIYDEPLDAINTTDFENDLIWWSTHYGVGTPLICPTFIACTAEDATSSQSISEIQQ